MDDGFTPPPAHYRRCPRCAYDLSGQIAAWTDHCSVEGRCPECGHGFGWRTLLAKKFREPDDFFDTAPAHRFRAWRITISRAKNPFRFWNWVKMEHPLFPFRSCWCAATGALCIHLVVIALAFTAGFVDLLIARLSTTRWGMPANEALAAAAYAAHPAARNPYLQIPGTISHRAVWMSISAIAGVLMPGACFVLLHFTLRRFKIRPQHLARIGAYSLAWAPGVLACASITFCLMRTVTSVLASIIPVTNTFMFRPYDGWGHFYTTLEWADRLLFPNQGLICGGILLLWSLVWWWRTCKTYLLLPHPFIIAAAITTVTLLFSVCVFEFLLGVDVMRTLLL